MVENLAILCVYMLFFAGLILISIPVYVVLCKTGIADKIVKAVWGDE